MPIGQRKKFNFPDEAPPEGSVLTPEVGRCRLTVSKHVLNAPTWFQRSNLKYDEMLSNCAFKFNLRRYTEGKRHYAKELSEKRNEIELLKAELAARNVGPGTYRPPRHPNAFGTPEWRGPFS
jgi:hypothetical protein